MRIGRSKVWVVVAGGLCLAGSGAMAMPESCQKEFGPMMEKRQAYINQINGFAKRKPTAMQACSTFKNLAEQNAKMGTWMASQKDWCQIPDDMVKQFSDAQEQINGTRAKVCDAAAKQAQMIKQMKARAAQQQGRQPQPGSGVRLPQGAL